MVETTQIVKDDPIIFYMWPTIDVAYFMTHLEITVLLQLFGHVKKQVASYIAREFFSSIDLLKF